MSDHYDILIVGGGFVGAALARALEPTALRVGVIEANPPALPQAAGDPRGIALAWGSRQILESLGLWPALAAAACPIKRIHISDRGHFGATRLDCREEHVPALGYVVPADVMADVFTAAITGLPDDSLLRPARVTAIDSAEDRVTVGVKTANGTRSLTAALVVGADGANSVVRAQLGISVHEHAYGQSAVIANITTSRPHDYTAYERFTDSGPVAMLPLDAQHTAMVWTVEAAQLESVMALDDRQFISTLQQRFGYRLGRILSVTPRQSWPLHLRRAASPVAARAVLVGNAAHTLHPVAGQGFNLGLRDVATLADVVTDAWRRHDDPGQAQSMQRYADWRRRDHELIVGFSDMLVRVFSNPSMPVALVRSLGLALTDYLPGVRHVLCRHTMGLAGRIPRLARPAMPHADSDP